MKHIILTSVLLLFIGISYLFAVDKNSKSVVNSKIVKSENIQIMPENLSTSKMTEESPKENYALKSKTLKRFFKKHKKLNISDDAFQTNRINALVIVGFLIFLPGLILTLLGVALIPALVLVIVGGTLWVIGLIKMKNSM